MTLTHHQWQSVLGQCRRMVCSGCRGRGKLRLRRENGRSYGPGAITGDMTCPFCHGRGWVVQADHIKGEAA